MSWNSGSCLTGGRGYWSGVDGLVEVDAADDQADEDTTPSHDVDEGGAR